MTIVIGAGEARRRFTLLGQVGCGGEVAIVERSGKPLVALIPIEVYEQLIAEPGGIEHLRARLKMGDCRSIVHGVGS